MLSTCADLFAKYLDSKNMRYHAGTDKDGDSAIEFPYQGKAARMFFTGEDGSYLSIYVVYERVPEDKLADVIFLCNELNARYKWVTFYVDSDNDVVLHDDAILSTANAAEEAFELLVRILKISDDIKSELMRTIYA